MSNPNNEYDKGRYAHKIPTSNLGPFQDDLELGGGAEAKPRTTGGFTFVKHVDMCVALNRAEHHSSDYETPSLVLRRGQVFIIKVSFWQRLQTHNIQVHFEIGSNPSVTKGSKVPVTFDGKGSWKGSLIDWEGDTAILKVLPSPRAIVGKYRTYVCVIVNGQLERTRSEHTDLYMLCNAWCPVDTVFLKDDHLRWECVLNERGVIYQGFYERMAHRLWNYGQFEEGVLDACISILDYCRMPISDRGDVIKLVRKGSAVMNSQDENGVLIGNWSGDYSMGRSPNSWTGSATILLQYAERNIPVAFAQCWVFAGVFNTFLRCLGIPARVVTNFNSAHDNTGNLRTDLIFKSDGTPDRSQTTDSIWNYHCWNEVYMERRDLPDKLGGWQVVDSTPQENSDGRYRCGPASVAAIKQGLLCHQYDASFVFAEVNSDVVCLKSNRYGGLTPFWVDTTHVGYLIVTKSVHGTDYEDITMNYKYAEGSTEDKETMDRAERFDCERDHSELPDTQITVSISADPCPLGHDVKLVVTFHNNGDQPTTISAHLDGSVIFYTGHEARHFKDLDFSFTVPPHQSYSETLKVPADEYLPHLGSQLALGFVVNGEFDGQTVIARKVVILLTPPLNMMVSGQPQIRKEMSVTVSFTNPFNFSLYSVHLFMEGSGLLSLKHRFFSVIAPHASITWTEMFYPRRVGHRWIVALMDCSNLTDVLTYTEVLVAPTTG